MNPKELKKHNRQVKLLNQSKLQGKLKLSGKDIAIAGENSDYCIEDDSSIFH
jgi:hypothetical protein